MFDDLENAFEGLDGGIQIPISIPLDDDGYLDRKCPGNECQHEFKVLFEDWEKIPEAAAYCPLCNHSTERNDFSTPAFDEYIGGIADAYVAGIIDEYMAQAARSFNQSQPRNSFVKMRMSYEPGVRPIMLPLEAQEQMRQRFTCEQCGCRYASVGAAFFCHACGHNSARSTFDQTIALVRKNLAALESVSKSIAENFDGDMAKDFTRETLEGNVGRLISAFQRLAEALFDELPNRSQFKPRKNLFQNLSESSALWRQAGKDRYEDALDAAEYADLVKLFQRRHVLEHREGIVDQAYIDNSGDSLYSVGQRLVIKQNDVERLAALIEKLAAHLRK